MLKVVFFYLSVSLNICAGLKYSVRPQLQHRTETAVVTSKTNQTLNKYLTDYILTSPESRSTHGKFLVNFLVIVLLPG